MWTIVLTTARCLRSPWKNLQARPHLIYPGCSQGSRHTILIFLCCSVILFSVCRITFVLAWALHLRLLTWLLVMSLLFDQTQVRPQAPKSSGLPVCTVSDKKE